MRIKLTNTLKRSYKMAVFWTFGFLLINFILGCWASCTEYDIRSCQESSGLKGYLRSQGIDITTQHAQESNWLFELDRTQLKNYCSLFDDYKDCMDDNVVNYCGKLKPLIIGINDAVHFMCKESFNEYINQHHECMSHRDVGDGLVSCEKSTVRDIQNDVNKREICTDLKEGRTCEYDLVQNKCGTDTADWLKKFTAKLDRPTLKYLGCNTIPSWAIGLLVVVGFVFLTMCCCAGGICYKRCQTARVPATTGRTVVGVASDMSGMDDAPPAYPGTEQVVVSDKKKLVPV